MDGTTIVELKDETKKTMFYIEAKAFGEQPVGFLSYKIDDLKHQIGNLAVEIKNALEKVMPTKTTVEFGIECSIKEGKLIAALTQGSAKGNLKIILEWSRKNGAENE